MGSRRKIEIFSAGCALCNELIEAINQQACPSCEIIIGDMKKEDVSERAKKLGVQSVPSVAIDGKLVDCCTDRGPELSVLQAAGLGQAF